MSYDQVLRSLAAVAALASASVLALACEGRVASRAESVGTGALAVTDELSMYAAACDALMGPGATVPAFSCDAQGIELPVTFNGAPFDPSVDTTCDAPNMFESDCAQHQKLVPLVSTATASVVAICHRFAPPDPGYSAYDQVSVIQTNKVTGDTCFYDSTYTLPDGTPRAYGSIPAAAPPPSAGVGTANPAPGVSFPYWTVPSVLAGEKGNQCVSCHDNGPYIRSPYVKQVASSLPANVVADLGFGNDAYNLTQPYHVVGAQFLAAGWRSVSLSIAGDTTCTSCHRLSANALVALTGTGGQFAVESVACYTPGCAGLNPPGMGLPSQNPAAPHWMVPGNTAFFPALLASAETIQSCARAWYKNPGALPAGCSAQPLTQPGPDCSATPNDVCGSVVISCAAYPETLVVQRQTPSGWAYVGTAAAGSNPTVYDSPTGVGTYRACSYEFPTLCSAPTSASARSCKCSSPRQCCIVHGGIWIGNHCE